MDKKRQMLAWMIVFIMVSFLPACKPGSYSPLSGDGEQMKGYLTLQDGRLVEYAISIPRSWIEEELFIYRKEGTLNYFDYNADPKQTVFSITAFTETEWQQVQQEPGHGEKIVSQDGIILAFNIALDNPYTSNQAEKFQGMAGEVKHILRSLTMTIVSTPVEMELARKTLIAFFDHLSVGNYAKAAELYGGTYENLIEMNPEADSNDKAALLEKACTINGFKCLKIKDIVREEQTWPDLFTFTLEFSNPDGTLLEISDCCDASGLKKPAQSRFEYRVGRIPQLGNIFLVQTLPVYMP